MNSFFLGLILATSVLLPQTQGSQLTLFTTPYSERYYTTEGVFATLIAFGTDVMPVQLGHSVSTPVGSLSGTPNARLFLHKFIL
jgi:hypothetical protein